MENENINQEQKNDTRHGFHEYKDPLHDSQGILSNWVYSWQGTVSINNSSLIYSKVLWLTKMQPKGIIFWLVWIFGETGILKWSEHDGLLGPADSWHYQFSDSVTVFSLSYHSSMAISTLKEKNKSQ